MCVGPGRHVARDEFVDLGFDRRALQNDAAVSPFDPAVAGCDLGFGEDHESALEAGLFRQPLDPLMRALIELVVDADHEMRRRDEMGEAVLHQARDLAERLGRDQFRTQLAGDRDRDVDSLGFHTAFDVRQPRRNALHRDPDLLERQRRAAIAFRLGLTLAGIEAVAIGARLRGRNLLRDFGVGRSPFARLGNVEGRMETEAVDVAIAVARKLCGELVAAEPLGEIVGLVKECFSHLVSTPHLVVRINASLYEVARDQIERLAKQSGFEGRLVILAEPEIATGDCRIEWADGGVVLERAAIDAKINELVDRYIASRNGAAPAAMGV